MVSPAGILKKKKYLDISCDSRMGRLVNRDKHEIRRVVSNVALATNRSLWAVTH